MKTSKSLAMFAKVDEWKESGQSTREFASSIGLSKSAFVNGQKTDIKKMVVVR